MFNNKESTKYFIDYVFTMTDQKVYQLSINVTWIYSTRQPCLNIKFNLRSDLGIAMRCPIYVQY